MHDDFVEHRQFAQQRAEGRARDVGAVQPMSQRMDASGSDEAYRTRDKPAGTSQHLSGTPRSLQKVWLGNRIEKRQAWRAESRREVFKRDLQLGGAETFENDI